MGERLSARERCRILEHARALIEKGWVQGMSAADDRGNPIDLFASKATRFCASAACARAFLATEDEHTRAARSLADRTQMAVHLTRRLAAALGQDDPGREDFNKTRSLVLFNDQRGRTQAEVLALFDRAIAQERKSL